MAIKLLGLGVAIALCPGVIRAQQTSSAGEVASNVPRKAIDDQRDASLIGSPAWWSTRATADGKPLSVGGSRAKVQKTPP